MALERPPKPLVSSRNDDPEFEEAIDAYVVRLGEIVDGLQDAEADGDLERLAERARAFAEESEQLGYAPMAEAAEQIARACDEASPDGAHKHVAEVTEVARRIRRGHRSAA